MKRILNLKHINENFASYEVLLQTLTKIISSSKKSKKSLIKQIIYQLSTINYISGKKRELSIFSSKVIFFLASPIRHCVTL